MAEPESGEDVATSLLRKMSESTMKRNEQGSGERSASTNRGQTARHPGYCWLFWFTKQIYSPLFRLSVERLW
jgi:hypothetical protein